MKRALWCLAFLSACGRSQPDKARPDLSQPAAMADGGVDDCPGGRNACGDCAPAQVEECNGWDDNCDGVIDEGCSILWPQLQQSFAPIRLFGDGVVIAQSGSAFGYTSANAYVMRLQYAASVGAAPDTLAQTPITDAGLQNESDRDPDFDGKWVTWLRGDYYGDPTNTNVVAMTLADRQQQILSMGLAAAGPPAVSGGRVVFAAIPSNQADSDIELFDLTTAQRTTLTFPGVFESAPDISGDWVVYERRDAANGDAQVRAIHIPDGVLDAPSEGLDGANTGPAIDGTHVVWTRTVSAATSTAPAVSEVWWYDLATREQRKLGAGQNPRVDGTLTCWAGSDGVWLADASTGRSARVVTSGGNCDVAGRRLAWIGHQGLTYRDLSKSEP